MSKRCLKKKLRKNILTEKIIFGIQYQLNYILEFVGVAI